jgi:hypothetical protein
MNYSEIDNYDNENILSKINNIEINNNSAISFLNEYEILKKSLLEYKNNLKELIKQKEISDNYLGNLLNNHMNIINIINCDNILNNSFNEYQKIIKDNYNKWIDEHYNIKIKILQENIENIEIKLKDFTNLFIYIINHIIQDKEISNNMCPICFENQIDICLNPCGHTACNKCILSITNNKKDKCFTCRSPVNEYIKIFFSL